ncbi:hypothetical protein C8Q79DRAFT_1048536 [Trametes meyenii]|nr:hypothetical protein C8Q79DRAFT_1048536 [Trametes meyenii]
MPIDRLVLRLRSSNIAVQATMAQSLIELEIPGRTPVDAVFQGLRGNADSFVFLIVVSPDLLHLSRFQELLRDGMRQLEHLRISLEFPSGDTQPSSRDMVLFDLPSGRFPSLRDLVLYGCGASLTPPLVSRLRRLVMTNEHGHTPLLPLVPFLDCVSAFDHLEELIVSNCFILAFPQDDWAPVPFETKRLIFVTIEDYPSNISQIISALVLPPQAKIRLIGNLRGASTEECCSAFITMLSGGSRSLTLLRHASRLEAHHSRDKCFIRARTDDDYFVFLKVITDALDKSALKRFRGKLFAMMVGTLPDLFPGRRISVTSLKFIGYVEYVPPATWISCLACFPSLLELAVVDVGLRASPQAVVSALLAPSPTCAKECLCGNLEGLSLHGDLPDFVLLEKIHECFKARKARGVRRDFLQDLKLELYCDRAFPESEVERYKKLLRVHAQRVYVTIYEDSGLRRDD